LLEIITGRTSSVATTTLFSLMISDLSKSTLRNLYPDSCTNIYEYIKQRIKAESDILKNAEKKIGKYQSSLGKSIIDAESTLVFLQELDGKCKEGRNYMQMLTISLFEVIYTKLFINSISLLMK